MEKLGANRLAELTLELEVLTKVSNESRDADMLDEILKRIDVLKKEIEIEKNTL